MDPSEVMSRPAAGPDVVLRYGDHADHLLDVHLPPEVDSPAPVVFLVHGGFWRQPYDRRPVRPLAEGLTAHGFAVVSAEYRRVGPGCEGGWPATFVDLLAGFTALPRLDDVAPGRMALDAVIVVGHSAGGHLAMLLGLRLDAGARSEATGELRGAQQHRLDAGARSEATGELRGAQQHRADRAAVPRVRRVVALAPSADLVDAFDRGIGDGAAAEFMGGSPQELPEEYAAASPAAMLTGDPGDVDIRVLHGDADQDVPVEMSRALTGVHYTELAGMEHFGLIDPLSAAWPHVLEALEAS